VAVRGAERNWERENQSEREKGGAYSRRWAVSRRASWGLRRGGHWLPLKSGVGGKNAALGEQKKNIEAFFSPYPPRERNGGSGAGEGVGGGGVIRRNLIGGKESRKEKKKRTNNPDPSHRFRGREGGKRTANGG